MEHHIFAELPSLLRTGDLLVLNETRVIPAKFTCRRKTGAKIDGLFCREETTGRWEVLLKGAGRCRPGEQLELQKAEQFHLELQKNLGGGRWSVGVCPPAAAVEILRRAGTTPLPPYIHRPGPMSELTDRRRYQTVYAARPGAVAAPTAGLHFTERLMDSLCEAGIQTARITLHVGPGTFEPVKTEDLADHRMHAEWYELPADAAGRLNAARREARRIVAVGTTSLRVLETVAAGGEKFRPAHGWTDLFIYPPAEFRAADALITNFHLPRSTLLMLVAAFCSPGKTDGVGIILDAYAEAVRRKYRFYSYGDAMLIE